LSKSTLQWERLTWVPGPGRAVPGRGWRYRSQIGRRVPRESRSWQEKVTKEGRTVNTQQVIKIGFGIYKDALLLQIHE
jgi:hypothetical protein